MPEVVVEEKLQPRDVVVTPARSMWWSVEAEDALGETRSRWICF